MQRVSGFIEDAVAAAPQHDVYLANEEFAPMRLLYAMGIPRSRFPGIGAYWVIAHGVRPLQGRRLFFVESEAGVLARIRRSMVPEVAALFVSPDAVPPGVVVQTSHGSTVARGLR